MPPDDHSPPRSPPSATVVVPTYARPARLARCVSALVALEYPRERLEIIVVDDGSPEPIVLDPLPEGAPAVRVVRQSNTGPARARNAGARAGSGEVLAFTDDDCMPDPAWLRHLVAALDEAPTALVGGHTTNALRDDIWAEASQTLVDFLYHYFPSARSLQPFFTSNNLAATAEAFWSVGGFDESFRLSAGEDRDLSERWQGPLRRAPEARVLHYHAMGPASFYRQHHTYGRGAVHLTRRRRQRTGNEPGLEPLSFYLRMLGFPVRRHGLLKGLRVSALIALSQFATAAGVFSEKRATDSTRAAVDS